MEGSKVQAFWVGSFLIIGIALLLFFSLRTRTTRATNNAYHLTAYFQKADGLEPGSQVTYRGVNVGSVESIELDHVTGCVRVMLAIKKGVKIRSDAEALVTMKSLLGQHYVNIRPSPRASRGEALAPFLEEGDELAAIETRSLNELIEVAASFSAEALKFFEEARETVSSVNDNQRDLFGKISDILDENRDGLKSATDAFGRAGPQLEEVMINAKAITGDLREGRGTIGRLLVEEDVYNNVDVITSNVAEISTTIKEGRGTIGRLVTEEDIYDELKGTFASVRGAGDEVKGVIADNRANIDQAIVSISEAGQGVNEVVSRVKEGTGTLSMLVNDSSLYSEATDAFKKIGKTFEQAEEQSVMRTFISVIFLGF